MPYTSVEKVIANLDEIDRRRSLARGFAEESMRACVPHIFYARKNAFDLLGIVDPIERLATVRAAALTAQSDTAEEQAWMRRMLDDEFARDKANLTAVDAAVAEQRAQAMTAPCLR